MRVLGISQGRLFILQQHADKSDTSLCKSMPYIDSDHMLQIRNRTLAASPCSGLSRSSHTSNCHLPTLTMMRNISIISVIRNLTIILTVFVLAGCATVQMPSISGTPTISIPDYSVPLDQFNEVQLSVVGSEFRDTLAGKYVYFDAGYVGLQSQVIIKAKGQVRPSVSPDLSGVFLAKADFSGSAQAVWPKEEREVAIPFISMVPGTPVRVYAYIIPTGTAWRFRNPGRYSTGFGEPLVLLMRVEPLSPSSSGRSSSSNASQPTAASAREAVAAPQGPLPTRVGSGVVDADLIRSVQAALKSAGYYSGSVDGKMGPQTKSAIEKYQRAAGLPIDGAPSSALLGTLERK